LALANQKKTYPLGQIMTAFDVLNGITIWADLLPIKISEHTVAQYWTDHYEADMLLIYDRGFTSFTSIFLHQFKECPQPYLMRCALDFNLEIREFVKSKKKDCIVEFQATRNSIKTLYNYGFKVPASFKVKVRLLKIILDNGTIEILATNLFNSIQFPKSIFKELYFKRWGIETKYDTVKNKLQLESYSGQKPITIMQDFRITFFLSNLQEIISKPCELEVKKNTAHRKLKYKVNRCMALGQMKNRIVNLFIDQNPKQILIELQQLFTKYIEPERPNRKYEHVRKSGRPKSKFQAVSNFKPAF
jgi:Transposase DDE domain